MPSPRSDLVVLRAAGRRAAFATVLTVVLLAWLLGSGSRASIAPRRAPGPATPAVTTPASPVVVTTPASSPSSATPSQPTALPPATRLAASSSGHVPAVAPNARVLVEGDSLAAGSAATLARLLPGRPVEEDYRVGRGTAEGASALAARGSGLPPVVVASLGTNDDPRPVIFRPAADRLVAVVGPQRCLVWPTVARPGAVRGVGWAAVNTVIREQAAKHPSIVVVDWAALLAGHPGWLAGSDGVHLTPAGYAARAAAIVDGVRRC